MRTHLALLGAAPLALFAACSAGETATTSSTSGTVGSVSSGAGAGDGCGAPNLQLDGTLEGAPVGEALFSDTTVLSEQGELSVTSAEACGCGMFLLTPSAPPPDGGAQPFTGLFRMPGKWPQPGGGAWFCAGEASASVLSPGVAFSLSTLSKLGACPAKGTSGSVFGCVGLAGSAACEDGADSSLVSTLFGATFAWDAFSRGYVGGDRVEVLTGIPSDGTDGAGSRLYLELEAAPESGGTAVVTGGVLLVGPGGPDPGGVYCIGGGTLADRAPRTFTLTGLSRLGGCGETPVAGSLQGHKKS